MSHWIEEAEKRQKENDITFDQGSTEGNTIINENHEKIAPFIQNITTLIDRVAKLSPDERKPSLEVGFTHLDGDVRYELYGSAFQIEKKRCLFFFNVTKKYLYWRRIYINVTDTQNLLKITLYEKGTSDSNPDDIVKKKMKFLTKIDFLSLALAYPIIDWLVFKTSSHELKRNIPSVK